MKKYITYLNNESMFKDLFLKHIYEKKRVKGFRL